MKRLLTLALAAALVAGPGAVAHEHRDYGRRVTKCDSRFDWTRPGQRADLVRCIGRVFGAPGGGVKMLDVGYCESGSDLQDTYGGDGYIGTFQHISSAWHGRWDRLGKGTGVPDDPTNVLSQSVVSAKMAKAAGTWADSWSCG